MEIRSRVISHSISVFFTNEALSVQRAFSGVLGPLWEKVNHPLGTLEWKRQRAVQIFRLGFLLPSRHSNLVLMVPEAIYHRVAATYFTLSAMSLACLE